MKPRIEHKVPAAYSERLTSFKKALYVLSVAKEFLPIRRIVSAITLLEGRQDDKEYDARLNRNVYLSVSKHAKNDSVIQRLRLGGEYMYGLKEWHEAGQAKAPGG